MKVGEKLFHFLAMLILDKFYGSVTIRFEHGKVTHVETETKRMWQYKDLPDDAGVARMADRDMEPAHRSIRGPV